MLWVLAYEEFRCDMLSPAHYGKPGQLDESSKDECDEYLQVGVEYYERQMSRVVSDVIRQESYGCLLWKTPSGRKT